jgi:hypothetical protein
LIQGRTSVQTATEIDTGVDKSLDSYTEIDTGVDKSEDCYRDGYRKRHVYRDGYRENISTDSYRYGYSI